MQSLPDRALRVLVVTSTAEHWGGLQVSAKSEAALLKAHGHDVHVLDHQLEMAESRTVLDYTRYALERGWNRSAQREIYELVADLRIDVVHVHGFQRAWFLSVHAAARRAGAATVQHLRDWMLLCLSGQLLRNDHLCEDCVGKIAWRGVLRGCRMGSRLRDYLNQWSEP